MVHGSRVDGESEEKIYVGLSCFNKGRGSTGLSPISASSIGLTCKCMYSQLPLLQRPLGPQFGVHNGESLSVIVGVVFINSHSLGLQLQSVVTGVCNCEVCTELTVHAIPVLCDCHI